MDTGELSVNGIIGHIVLCCPNNPNEMMRDLKLGSRNLSSQLFEQLSTCSYPIQLDNSAARDHVG